LPKLEWDERRASTGVDHRRCRARYAAKSVSVWLPVKPLSLFILIFSGYYSLLPPF
jgi:hypothetical protein